MLITCCLLAADGVLQISGKRKLTSGKMEDKENGKTPAQLKDELSGLKMRALQQKAEEVGVAQDLIDTADDSPDTASDESDEQTNGDDETGSTEEVSAALKRQRLFSPIIQLRRRLAVLLVFHLAGGQLPLA